MNSEHTVRTPAVRPCSLVLEDDETLAATYKRVLESLGYEVILTHRIDEARVAIRDQAPELMLVDIDLPDGNGLDLMDELRSDTRGRFIVISGDDSQRAAIKSIRNHAVELLLKPVDLSTLRDQLLPAGIKEATGDPSAGAGVDDVDVRAVWISAGRHHSLSALRTAMSYSSERRRGHALISGEPGVEKIEVARAIHARGRRAGRCLLVDCNEVSGPLGLVRLFGQEDPATGEIIHRGYLEQAAAGTLILDHVEKLSKDVQSRFLPFLDSGTFRRVDGDRAAQANLSVIGIARDSGTTDVDESALRTDFLFRLAQTTLAVPNLRQCMDDIHAIADLLLAQASIERDDAPQFSAESRVCLENRTWKRNVRELRSVIEQALAATPPGQAVDISSDEVVRSGEASRSDIQPWVGTTVWELERQLLNATLAHFEGDKEKTAQILGVSLKTLYNRMSAY
ncbi:MAG: sigma-54-dependent Fis family transcriptional regulator [Granulosicoccus sp.]|nr:sigma-54-dependent Fis family transcriptional regulator [Granulosicoccus sp.]